MREVDLPDYAVELWQPFRHLAWYGGRGGGKSRTVATGLVLQSCERHERFCAAVSFRRASGIQSKRLIDDEIDRLGLRPAFQSTETEIRGSAREPVPVQRHQGQRVGAEVDGGPDDVLGRRGAGLQPGVDRHHHSDDPARGLAAYLDVEPGPADRPGRRAVPRQSSRGGRIGRIGQPPPASIVREINYRKIRGSRTCSGSRWSSSEAATSTSSITSGWASTAPIRKRGYSRTGAWRRSRATPARSIGSGRTSASRSIRRARSGATSTGGSCSSIMRPGGYRWRS
jgi:hypothetical protein